MSRRRRRWLLAGGATLLTAGVLWLLWPEEPDAAAANPTAAATPAPLAATPVRAVEPPTMPGPTAPPADAPPPPIIDEISVEKPEVCEGEENLISIRAHTADGTDAFLHYLVGSTPGQRVPVRTHLDDDDPPEVTPRLEVKVFGKNNVATTAAVPPFVVKECQPRRVALITPRLRANTWSEFDFDARVVEPDGAAAVFKPREYRWQFGDGQAAVTDVPHVVHSYEDRPQDTHFSNLLVKVEIRGDGGEPVVGRTALQLLNPAFEDFATKGVVSLQIQLTPRFPALGPDGVVRQRVRLFHHRDRPVYLHDAVAFRHRAGETVQPPPDLVSPETLLGGTSLPPGRGREFEVKLDTRADPEVFSIEYLVSGKDSEGNPARGAFSVMRPPPAPTKENSAPVIDPLLKAKILEARRLLGQPYVTDEDLWRLEREGKFAHLSVPPPTVTPDPPARDAPVAPPEDGPRGEVAPAPATKK